MLEAVADATKRLGEQTDGLDEIVAQAQTAWTNFLDELGSAIATSDRHWSTRSTGDPQTFSWRPSAASKTTLIEAIKTCIEDLDPRDRPEYGSTAAQVIATIGEGWHTFALAIETCMTTGSLQAQERVAQIPARGRQFQGVAGALVGLLRGDRDRHASNSQR